MMQGSDFQEALLRSDGTPAKVVSDSQGGLAPVPNVFSERRTVFGVESCGRFGLSFGSLFHARTPVKRATKTSASSFPREYFFRILSATRCGDSRTERPSVKSSRTPSVAKIRVSSLEIVRTAACSEGHCEPHPPARTVRDSR